MITAIQPMDFSGIDAKIERISKIIDRTTEVAKIMMDKYREYLPQRQKTIETEVSEKIVLPELDHDQILQSTVLDTPTNNSPPEFFSVDDIDIDEILNNTLNKQPLEI